ncbi:MAG: hypothetical protein AAB538_00740, partial [Patescibacteria group bacterium]
MTAIMRYAGHTFRGELPDNGLTPPNQSNPGYWEIVETPKGQLPAHPLPPPWRKWSGWRFVRWLLYSPVSFIWWVWKRWVYHLTGGIFTGLYPFQEVLVYPVERFKLKRMENGDVDLERWVDNSDHFRVADFEHPVLVQKADTQDKQAVRILVNFIGRVFNVYLAAFNTDGAWPSRLFSAISGTITTFTRSRTLDKVLSAKDAAEAAELKEVLLVVGFRPSAEKPGNPGSAASFGITGSSVDILDISASNPEDANALAALARARITRQATEELAIGNAAPLREAGKVLADHPETVEIARIEGDVRIAQAMAANSNAIVVLGRGGQGPSDGEAAIIREVRSLRKSG